VRGEGKEVSACGGAGKFSEGELRGKLQILKCIRGIGRGTRGSVSLNKNLVDPLTGVRR